MKSHVQVAVIRSHTDDQYYARSIHPALWPLRTWTRVVGQARRYGNGLIRRRTGPPSGAFPVPPNASLSPNSVESLC